LRGKRGQVQIDVPRDRASEFEPQLVRKGQARFDGLGENIISPYARGMTQREIQGHLEEIYGVEVSPSLISTVTDAVLDEVRAWQSRPPDAVYPILYLDALQVKVKSQGRVSNKAIYIAFAVNLHSLKEVLGMWTSDNEGAKFWMQIVTELKNRGIQDIFIACVDGLKGLPEAIEAVYPQTQVQLCVVHMVRHSLSFVSHKDRKAVATDLKAIYQAATLAEAERQLAQFEEAWAESYPVIARSWRQHWARVVPMRAVPKFKAFAAGSLERLTDTIRSPSITVAYHATLLLAELGISRSEDLGREGRKRVADEMVQLLDAPLAKRIVYDFSEDNEGSRVGPLYDIIYGALVRVVAGPDSPENVITQD
jgi:putative transposase